MELIYRDFKQWELEHQNEFIKSLAPDFRANLALNCPDSERASKRSGFRLRFGWPIIHGGQRDPAPRTPGHSESLEERERLEEKPEETEITKEEKNVGSKGGTSEEKALSKELDEEREEEENLEEPKDKKEDRKVRTGGNSQKRAISKVSGEESETEPEKKKRSSQVKGRKTSQNKTR
ncbi:MAG: hypothetical protein Q9198_000430 [Flavoplaca austrocitrina]